MFELLRRLLAQEVLLPHHRERLVKLVTMRGISDAQQEELYREVMKVNNSRVFELMARYEAIGATYVYPSRAEVASKERGDE